MERKSIISKHLAHVMDRVSTKTFSQLCRLETIFYFPQIRLSETFLHELKVEISLKISLYLTMFMARTPYRWISI